MIDVEATKERLIELIKSPACPKEYEATICNAIDILKHHYGTAHPNIEQSIEGIIFTCGFCGNRLHTLKDTASLNTLSNHIRFCSFCGKAVKWGN